MIRILIVLILSFMHFYEVEAQQKFECDGNSYVSVIDAGFTSFYELSFSDNGVLQRQISQPTDANINAIGYNPKDSLIYGMDTEVNQLYRIWADGLVEGIKFIPLEGDFFAGDIHPDGDKLILLNNDSIAIIQLDTAEDPVEYIKIKTADSTGIFTTDIAYHPVSGKLFGYDGIKGKLITIDDSTGAVDNISYPSINFNDGIPALFFDARGELYGLGNNNTNGQSIVFKFDTETGNPSRFAFDSTSGDRDGCSCPFTFKLFQKINNDFLVPCTKMEVSLTISNLTNQEFVGYDLVEVLPSGYSISEITYNPFAGDVISGAGEDQLYIDNMIIPFGIDSIKFLVDIPENAAGEMHEIQAELSGPSPSQGITNTIFSNDLLQTEKNSPTQIEIQELDNIFSTIIPEVIELCAGDTFHIDLPANNGLEYTWSDGIDTLSRYFVANQQLSLDIENECGVNTIDIEVQETQFSISLGEDQFVMAGDLVVLAAEISSLSPVDSFIWKTINGDIACNNCSSIQVQITEDIKYILVAENASGCKTSDEINFFANRSLYTPDAFSPNGDGINDYFYFLSSQPGLDIKALNVYDRWGGQVFAANNIVSNNETLGWNGKRKGQLASAGTYFWTAIIAYNDQREEYIQGSVILMR